jgi:hypothetical protein
MVGDVILYDAPSFYDRYTIDGVFPVFPARLHQAAWSRT